METHQLLELYLFEYSTPEHSKDLTLERYTIDGSKITLEYSYNPNYEWDVNYISYDNYYEVNILDYLTWIHNRCYK